MKVPHIILILLLGVSSMINGNAQGERVTINYTERPLKEILNDLSQRYGLHFSYRDGLPVLNQVVTIDVTDQSLDGFLNDLLSRAGIEYKMINRHVALHKKSAPVKPTRDVPDAVEEKSSHPGTKADPAPLPIGGKQEPASSGNVIEKTMTTDTESVTVPVTTAEALQQPGSAGLAEPHSNNTPPLPQKAFTFEEGTSGAHKQHNFRKLDLGLIASLDFYDFYSTSDEGEGSSYSEKINYSGGLYIRKMLHEKWSVELQTRLASRNLQVKYNYRATDPLDPFVVDKTSFKLTYLSVPVRVNYLILEKNEWELTGGLGVVFDIKLKEKLNTYMKSGDGTTTPELVGGVRSYSIGSFVSLQARYALKERMWINLSPSYRQYFTSFSDGAMNINMRMLTIEFGLLFGL